MGSFKIILFFLIFSFLSACLYSQRSKSRFHSFKSKSQKWRNSRFYGGRSRFYNNPVSGLSFSRKTALFSGGMIFMGMYMGSRIRSHRDLNNYEVCKGERTQYINTTNKIMKYEYFICPSDMNAPFDRYCCYNSDNKTNICCSTPYSRYGGSYSWLTSLLFIGGIVALSYYCLRRRRLRDSETVISPTPVFPHGSAKPEDPIPPMANSYPPTNLYYSSSTQNVANLPYPLNDSNFATASYPPVANQPMPTNANVSAQIGTSWNESSPYPSYPPPPYPGTADNSNSLPYPTSK